MLVAVGVDVALCACLPLPPKSTEVYAPRPTLGAQW